MRLVIRGRDLVVNPMYERALVDSVTHDYGTPEHASFYNLPLPIERVVRPENQTAPEYCPAEDS
jgi:hypothetical protein